MDCLDASRVDARDIQPHLKRAFSWKTMAFSNIVCIEKMKKEYGVGLKKFVVLQGCGEVTRIS